MTRSEKPALALVLILALALFFSGCSSEKVIETDEAEIVVDKDDETVEYSSKDDTVKAEINLEGGARIPDGYPEGVLPLYPGSVIIMGQVFNSESETNYSVSLKESDEIETVYAFYKDIIKKAENLMDLKTQNTHSLAGSIDGYDFGIVIAPNNLGGDEKTMVQISISQQK